MAGSATVPSVTCSLHPLVIMNISDHWTRIRAQNGMKSQVYGALIGKQKGRNIEVMNSFELKFELVNDEVHILMDYYNTKEEQCEFLLKGLFSVWELKLCLFSDKQVFSDLDFLGWYTTGSVPSEKHINIHKQICQINECPIMVLLDPTSRNMNQLPISLYESVIDIVQGDAVMLFVPLTYTLATEEAERIGVDHVARMSTNDSDENSTVAEHLLAQHSAIKMLHSRIKIVLAYIKAVESGQLEANQEILRGAYSLSRRLPVIQNPSFKEEFYTVSMRASGTLVMLQERPLLAAMSERLNPNSRNEIKLILSLQQSNDVGLITYLGALTKVSNDMNQLVNKFNVLYDRQGMGRRMRGLFF